MIKWLVDNKRYHWFALACATVGLLIGLLIPTPARPEAARYPVFRSPVMDCLQAGRPAHACRGVDRRSAKQIYRDMMGDIGYSPGAADRLYGKGKPSRTLKCKPDGSGGFDCEYPR